MPRLWLLLAGLELCFADWTVASGACRVDSDGCLQSPRYPSSYRNSQNCEVTVADGNSKSINVKAFDTETGYDILEVNGRQYSGTAGPNDVVPSGTITWSSDYSITAGGWRLCLQDLCVGNEKITGNGEDYRGCQTRTRSGKTCQRWDADNPHNVGIYRPSVYSSLADNYCRNPGGSGETIWCFTTDPDVKWEYCDHLPLWTIEEGSCSTDLACSRSPGYPENYGTNQVCTLKVGSGAQGGVLQVNHFETELNYDLLSVDGSAYSGNAGPPAQEVTSEMQITWVSDHSITKSGWEICIVFPESDATSTSATQTSSTSTSFTTSMTTRTITFSTTLVSNISLRGQLFLGVSDPSAAEATFETETGSQALRQGIADPFDDIQPDSVELLGVMVVTAARRLSSAGQVLVDYIVTVAVGAALDHSLLSSSSTALTQSINQALTNANIAITISSAQHVELTTTTSRTETLTQTSSTTRSATTTSATRTITTTRVNCQFSDWSSWGKCNRPCNGGNQTRTRSVAVPEVNGGTPCVGDEEEMLECNAQTCAQCVPGYHLVFVSNEEVSCIPCERGRYNPVASSDSSGACRLCERGEESFGGAAECTPCSLGSAATQQLNPTVSATAASQVQSFGAVDATSMELQCDCTGSLSFQAACATARSVNFTVEVWLASSESVLLELQLGSGAPVGWNFNVAQGLWQTTSASPQLSFPQGESLVRLWTSTQGLRIRSLTMQYPSNMDECGFVPSEEIWTCSRCAPGEFADSVGMTECKQCAAGSYSSESGSSVCEACKPGSFGNRSGAGDFGVCQDCPMGFFGNFSGMSECEPCAAGSFSNQSGVSSSDECLQCLPGTASDPGSAFCNDCEAGRFAGVGAAGCSACPAGEVAMSPGSSTCVPCNAGTYAENGTVCTPCPSGSYSTAMAAAGLEMCQACPAGTFSEMPGADNQTKCLDCSAGSFSTAGSSACELCSSGQISGFAATSCQQCALGSFAGSPGMSACELCLAGTYGHNDTSSCLQCGAGSYSQALGATGPETCVACAAGTASQATGASSPLTCEPCLPGLAADAGSAECSVCVAGTYSTPQQVCEPCPLGQFVEYFGQTECFECWPGTFNDDASTPTVECQACPVGSFLNFRGGTAMADCQACPAGTSGGSQGMPECEECPAGSVSRTDGNSRCEACPAMSDTPAGAVACCPSENLEKWGSSTGSLSLAPGKSKSEVYYISTPGSCDSATVEASSLVQDGQVFPGEVKLVTMGQDSIHSCLELACNEEDKAHCSLRVILGGRENFGTGETLKVQALIETKDGTQVCTTTTDIVFEGFGCAPNTLQFFLLALSVVVSGTVLLGLTFELIGNCRLLILVECTFSIKLPKMWASRSPLKHSSTELERIEIKAAPAIPVAGSSPPRRLSERESELVVAEEVRLPGMESLGFSDEEDAVKIGWKDSADPEDMADDAAGPVFVPRAKSSHLDHADVLLEPGERKILRSASHGAVDKGDDEEEESRSSFAWPSQAALKQSVSQLLKIEPRRFVHFAAWAVKFEDAPMLQVEYAVRVPKGQHLELRQQLSRCKWRLAPNLPAPWDQATVQQQPPAFIKAQARAPGMDLLDFVEKLATKLTRTKKEEEDAQQLQQLHLEVARHLLRRLTSRNARIFLGIQYFCNLCAAAFLPFAGYQMMTSCDEGFPTYIHGAWFLYMCITNLMSFALLRTVSGQHAAAFCYRFRWRLLRLLFRAVCSFILLTDTYQDATFPVIANKCNFELWFVSAWLVGLGVGLMQVLVQLLVIASCAKKYQNATTPEERDRLLVQGAFIALRGSDNLVLVYAVRPAVEERLGGSSSWAMKLSEARIALLRFIFEDVEQSALQAVFLIFYDEAAIGDKLWVTTSILTSLLLSFTIVVQCMPEVRDWLWHRVFASFPGGRMIPPLRVFWFILVALIYRCLSAFPWISACSPTGDPCQSREWWEFYWGCANGRTTLLGLEARIKVVDETISNSTIGVAIILSAVALATVVWWTRKKCLSIYQRMKLDSLESYNFSKRMQPQQGQPLRPLLDADDDLWLDAARQLYPVLSRAQVHKQKAMAVTLETIDRNTFTVSRAHLGGWSLPGVHWYLCRQIPKKLNKFVQTANSLALPQESMTNVYLFRTTVSHAVRVAKVRRHVQQLLSNRHFIKASLERKASWILECPDTPPVRLLHWSEIAKAGALPKYQNGGAAKPVEQLLEDVAERLSVPRESVEQRLVVFLLSHRWLRTESDYHPDSEDNVKANKLVSFARWFMRLADAAGVPCEVAFWIDYCCCEQEDRFGMDLAMAALPLYIACCTKVVVWRTPDFDRRCWTMVERLLSYSFCSGGLTPYVIDSSFVDEDEEEEEDEEDEASHPDDSPSIWEVRLDDESWVPFDDFAQAILRSAKAAGLPRSEVMSVGRRYEVDFKHMCQKSKESGKQRQIRERSLKPGAEGKTWKEAKPALVSERQKPGRASQSTINSIQDRIHRVAKKLPNPLDPETCLLSRESHRRHISSLVSVAMQVPAFEVFADRQPVEWGLTEVIEHSLVSQEPLPKEGVTSDLLELSAGRVGPNAPTTSWWKLVVLEPGKRTRHVDPLSDMDVIVWMDYGSVPSTPPPSPEQLEMLFADVDLAIDQGTKMEREECIKELILALKADLTAAVNSNDEAQMEAAVVRAREVELQAKTSAVSCLVTNRLLAAAESGSEAEMRNALRFAREKGMEKLQVYKEVLALQQGLYGKQLLPRLERLVSEDADFAELGAVHHTAETHGLVELARRVLALGESRLKQAALLDTEDALQKTLQVRDEAKACGWSAVEQLAEVQVLRLTMELALARAEHSDDMATLRAVEMRAQQENFTELAERAARKVNETARKVGQKMGLPAGWDVVERMAGTDAARLLKKDEETGQALLKKVQELVDATFWGWGGHGAKTRTRDRGSEPVAKKLKVVSVIYVQNAEVYVNYRARREEISASITAEMATGDAWDVKTAAVPLLGGRLKENPVDPSMNEHYLWHGCKPEGAEGITDANFDLKRAGSAYGSLFGPGIYLAESCMKADEYTSPDARGYFPLLLCRATLGNINYCDHPSPVSISPSLVASCKAGGGYHSVLGDREKINGTFREFIVFDNHQVYPEYIVWYQRQF